MSTEIYGTIFKATTFIRLENIEEIRPPYDPKGEAVIFDEVMCRLRGNSPYTWVYIAAVHIAQLMEW